MAAPDPNRQRQARERLTKLFAQRQTAFVVHYACDTIFGPNSARVTSIVARNLGDGSTHTFSLHQEAELQRLAPARALQCLDDLERAALEKFVAFLGSHQRATYVHWNMRDSTYGFAALEHRYQCLGGSSTLPVHDSQKLDLAIVLNDIYGENYVPRPHIEHLAKMNALTVDGFVSGKDEPELLQKGQLKSILVSNTRKATLIAEIAQLAHDYRLLTDKGWWELNGGRLREAYEAVKLNPAYAVAAICTAAASTAFTVVLKVLEYLEK